MPISRMFKEAVRVLRRNDMGGWTRAAPKLYPHQWRWDSAFIAIGLARLAPTGAARELTTLFEHQLASGKVPHIVFNSICPRQLLLTRRGPLGNGAEPARRPVRAGRDQRPVPAPVHAIAAGRIR